MPAPFIPENETGRLEALRGLDMLDTLPEPRFDVLTRLAAEIYETPIATLSLVDADRQWFKSAVGLEQGTSTPRADAFCAHAILQPDFPMVVEDAASDPRFAANPLVTGPPHIRFYAGVPLRDRNGHGMGTLCVIDTKPRRMAPGQLDQLAGLAAAAMAGLELARTPLSRWHNETFARQIMAASSNSINVLDLEGRVIFMNDVCRNGLHLPQDAEMEGQCWVSLWPESEREKISAHLALARQGLPARTTALCPLGDGTPRWWDNTVTLIPGIDGQAPRLLSSSRDVTAAKHERDQLDAARAQLAAVLESTSDHVIVVDHSWTITYLNPRAEALLGDGKTLLGASLWQALPYVAGSDFESACSRALSERKAVMFEDYLPSRDLWLDVHATPTADGLSIFFRDATERHRTQAQLMHLVEHDSLTGLANRFVLHKRMAELAQGRQAFAVLMIDLDHFKDINDTFGHPVGDSLLQQAAKRLRSCVRRADAIARLGGDEFAVLLSGPKHRQDAAALSGRIVTEFGAPFDIEGMALCCGASIGIAHSAESRRDPDSLLKDADLALYAAKAAGRATFRFFSVEMAESAAARQVMKTRLREALASEEMRVVFQPVIDLNSETIGGFEALLRWDCPGRGMVPPSEFIPIAEETGLIVQIGRWALRMACLQAARWPDDIWVAVNLSPVQFRDPGLVEAVSGALAESGLPARRLELEITETALLRDDDTTLAMLRALRGLGVRMAMDDFGTGFASLSYLRSFPFDKIKIDQSFVCDLPDSAESTAIVRAVTSMGNSLSLTITAEGVETEEQCDAVRQLGCRQAQGYFFSQPISAEAAMTLAATPDMRMARKPPYGRKTDLGPPKLRLLSRHI